MPMIIAKRDSPLPGHVENDSYLAKGCDFEEGDLSLGCPLCMHEDTTATIMRKCILMIMLIELEIMLLISGYFDLHN